MSESEDGGRIVVGEAQFVFVALEADIAGKLRQ